MSTTQTQNAQQSGQTEQEERDEDVRELVKARLGAMPVGFSMSIGGEGSFSRDDLIQHVSDGDEIGKKMIEIDMNFLQSLKTGELYEYSVLSDEA
ncbi:MAG: hypothetical protein HYT31_00355 [Parcubacteria group bacterium]|nr:hypothetical protein [Parcubacteria group bacterium]